MTITATNLVGHFTNVPGFGRFPARSTHEVSTETAAWMSRRPREFTLKYDPSDLPLRGADGQVNKIGFTGPITAKFGYGGASITILRALTALGVEASVKAYYNGGHETVDRVDLPPEAASQLAPRSWLPQAGLVHCLPDDLWRSDAPRRVMWTMFETDRIPDGTHKGLPFGNWAKLINAGAERLIVPCRHNKEVFRDCGVKVPITVLNYGLETDIWPYAERAERDTFTVFQFGDLTSRKGPEEAVDAFLRAFPDQQDVRLVLKTQPGNMLPRYAAASPKFRDPRITVINETWTRAELLSVLHRVDCYIFLSRGEGFSLTPLQAALTGLPVIMTTHTGQAEFYRPQFFHGVRSTGMSDCPMGGRWYEPDVEHAAEQLRKVYNDRKKATKMAKACATYVRNNFSLENFTANLGTFLDTL